MNEMISIDEAALSAIVGRFYGRVRGDEALGPLFNDAIHDWPAHLSTLADFWSSVMLTSGRYKGNPMAAHMKHQSTLTPALFDRWLALWAETTNAEAAPEIAQALQLKAHRIAESLKLALFYRPTRQSDDLRPRSLPLA